jgi:hypothetical protein|tara:strand:- start:3660 stop:4733 length:1074 start_codon:yes stop_codon:yes gene_type:complete
MAKKTIFQDIDITVAEGLGVEDGVYYGVYSTSGPSADISTILGTENYTVFSAINDLLITETTKDLSKLKKAFILPGSSVSADRIKEACKEHSISITNDYETADFIINDGNSAISELGTHSKFSVKSLLHHFNNGYVLDFVPLNIQALGTKFEEYQNLNSDKVNSVIYDKRTAEYHSLHSLDYSSAPYDNYLITGLALNLANLIHKKELDVVEVDTILGASNNVQVLTKDLLDTMDNMWKSGSDDKEMLGSLLCTIDYNKTPALMWKLSQIVGNKEYYWSRNKDVKYWYNVSGINELAYFNAEEALKFFISKDVMDKDNFKILEPICRSEIYISNRELYSFTVQVKPEYRKYLKKQKI